MPPIALWRLGQIIIAGAALAVTHRLVRQGMKARKAAAEPQPPAAPVWPGDLPPRKPQAEPPTS